METHSHISIDIRENLYKNKTIMKDFILPEIGIVWMLFCQFKYLSGGSETDR